MSIIGEIERNSMERIRVSVETYKNHIFIDLRTYFEDDEGEWRPTKKGITIQPDKVDEVNDLIKKADEVVRVN